MTLCNLFCLHNYTYTQSQNLQDTWDDAVYEQARDDVSKLAFLLDAADAASDPTKNTVLTDAKNWVSTHACLYIVYRLYNCMFTEMELQMCMFLQLHA